MTIEDHYRKVRATVRQLGRRESLYVIWAYCQYLQVNEFNIPADESHLKYRATRSGERRRRGPDPVRCPCW